MQPRLIEQLKQNIHQIDAGYDIFEIKFLEKVHVDGQVVEASTDFNTKVIEITDDLSDAAAKEVVYHELTHILLEMAGLGEDFVTRLTNEEMTLSVSRALMTLMRHNEELFKLLEGYLYDVG